MPKYRFVQLPLSDGDDRKVTVGMDVLTKKDLGRIIDTKQDLDENVHFKRVYEEWEHPPEEEEEEIEGGIDALPPANLPSSDFLEQDQGFLLPPGMKPIPRAKSVEKEEKKSSPKRKRTTKKKRSTTKKTPKKAVKGHPEATMRAYTVNCYQCAAEFKKKAHDIFSLNPWELVCPSCKKKKK